MLNLFSLKDGKKEGQTQGNKKRASAAQVRFQRKKKKSLLTLGQFVEVNKIRH
jgi:hypothetical protein